MPSTFRHPVFILASPFSFTSITGAILGQHPDLYYLPATNILIAETIRDFTKETIGKGQILTHGLFRTIAQLYAGEQTMDSIALARRWLHRRINRSTREVYFEIGHRVSPLQIIDRSPSYSNPNMLESLHRIRKTFPNAFYLHLLRHPRTQGKSWWMVPEAVVSLIGVNSLDYSTDPPTADPQFDWHRIQNHITEFLKTIPENQQLRMHGENIMNDPPQTLQKLCRWLGIEWNDKIYQSMLHPENSSYACVGPYGAQWGQSPEFQRTPLFTYKKIKPSRLSGPLPWRRDKKGFTSELIQLAQNLGYE